MKSGSYLDRFYVEYLHLIIKLKQLKNTQARCHLSPSDLQVEVQSGMDQETEKFVIVVFTITHEFKLIICV